MQKYLFITTVLVFVTHISFSQDTRSKIERALTHPRAAENAAKADAMLIDKTIISHELQWPYNRECIEKKTTPPAKESAKRKKNKK